MCIKRVMGYAMCAALLSAQVALAQTQQPARTSSRTGNTGYSKRFSDMTSQEQLRFKHEAGRAKQDAAAAKHLPAVKTAQANATINPINIPIPDNSLWFRYYRGGEQALIKHDPETAKKYFFASLGQLEKVRSVSKTDVLFAVKLSALEQYLEESYPTDWSKPVTRADGKKLSEDDVMKLRGEQVQVLYRISNINARFVPARDLLRSCENKMYTDARSDYLKAQAAKKVSGQPGAGPQ